MKKKYAFAVLSLTAALVGTGAAYSSLAAGGPSDDPFVMGGGRFGPGCFDVITSACFGAPRDLSIDAHLERKGTKVSGAAWYGNNAGAQRYRFDITCLSIAGNRAAIGGIVRESNTAADVGRGALVFLRDEGSPGLGTRDRSSGLYIDPLGAPEGFPYTCPTPDSSINGAGFQDIHSGDVVISAGDD